MTNHKVNQFFTIPTFLFIILTIYSFSDRYIESDECWLGEQSLSFLKLGYVRLKSIPNIIGLSDRNFVYHKLYTWMHSPIIALFGWNITVLKTCTLSIYIIFLISIKNFVFERVDGDRQSLWVIILFLLIVNPLLILKSFSFRPDVLMMTLGFLSFFFLSKSNTNKYLSNGIFSGFFAGLAVLIHLNGISIAIAGFIYLLTCKKWKSAITYSIIGFSISSLYFIDLLPEGHFDQFMYQITNWPTINHGSNFIDGGITGIIKGRFFKLLQEQQRFFWSYKVACFSFAFFFLLFSNIKYLKTHYGSYLKYFLILVLSTNIFGSHIAQRYLLFYFPIMSLIMAISIDQILKSSKNWIKVLTSAILVVQASLGVYMLSEIFNRSYDYETEHKETLEMIGSKKVKILAPWEMIYNEFESYDLYNFKTYEYTEDLNNMKITPEELLTLAATQYQMDYVIMKLNSKSEYWYPRNVYPESAFYTKFFENNKYTILKKVQ